MDVEGLQIIQERRGKTDAGDHWIVVHWKENQLFLYDSAAPKNPTIVASVAARLRTLIPINILPGSLVEIFYMSVQQQKNGFDCGIFAIAFVAEIISGKDVTKTRLNGDRLRQFFIASYRSMEIDVFPSTGGRNRKETDPVVLSIRI